MRASLKPAAWSYRFKVPLLIALICVVTALAVSSAIAWSARHWLREDLRAHAIAVAQSLARGLAVNIARDDVWEAYEAVRASAGVDRGTLRGEVVVLDREQRVFVSSEPLRFGVGAVAEGALSPALSRAAALPAKAGKVAADEVNVPEGSFTVVNMPLLSADQESIGRLLISYSHAVFEPRYRQTITRLGLITASLILLLIPLGWWLGHRLASPLARVTDTLYGLGEVAVRRSPSLSQTESGMTQPAPRSELARLEHSLARLQQQLDEKEQLQEQFVAADRLAAIGRMTAAVAHEINNPLAGMLNALSNLRRDPSLLQKTLALMERGLEQVRQTLSALLIETKTAPRALTPADIEDLRLLIHPQAQRKHVQLIWHYLVEHTLPVPAAPTRQVVLNLLLNAVQASASRIEFSAQASHSELIVSVANDGDALPAQRREHPFEPVAGAKGHGLGLWASHQLVTSMGGQINVRSEISETVFEVRLPFHPSLETKVGSVASETERATP